MRTAKKNKQRMFYSLYNDRSDDYETDGNGDIRFTFVDGERVPITTGYAEHHYSAPVPFIANIMPIGSESYARGNVANYRAYGVDISEYDALILANRGEFPLTESSLIWLNSAPTERDSADYVITDVDAGEPIYDSDGDLIRPVSGSIPVIDESGADYIVKRVANSQNITLYLLGRINGNGKTANC